jgi:hypothetical protein
MEIDVPTEQKRDINSLPRALVSAKLLEMAGSTSVM